MYQIYDFLTRFVDNIFKQAWVQIVWHIGKWFDLFIYYTNNSIYY